MSKMIAAVAHQTLTKMTARARATATTMVVVGKVTPLNINLIKDLYANKETQIAFILIIHKEFVNNLNHYNRPLPSQFQSLEGADPCTPGELASLHQS